MLAGRWALPILAVAAGSHAIVTTTTTSAPASRPGVVSFQPGVRIDWVNRHVEVDATVILREGLIELFACSPRMREHEAIVRIEARPLHVFHALGLIGLTPGHPVLYDIEADRRTPATGDPVAIDVRHEAGGQAQTVPIEHWLVHSDDGRKVGRLPWVLAGSVLLGDDSIAADHEGTVVALVDFGSSLVALPELHTDRNADLWLKPNTPAIPPVGTRCVLVFRAGAEVISLDAAGRIRLQGRRMTLGEAATRLATRTNRPGGAGVRVVIDPACPEPDRKALIRVLESCDLDAGGAEVETRPTSESPVHHPDALVGWLTWQLSPLPGIPTPAESRPQDEAE